MTMLRFAVKQMRLEPVRSSLTIVVLASVISVILVLEGFEQGQYHQLERIVLNRGADLIVSQAGVRNFIAVRSSLPQTSREQVEAIEGVAVAHPMTAIPIIYNKKNIRTPVYVIVYDTIGGPSSIIKGRKISKGREIVIDQALAKKYQLTPGDSFDVTDFRFKIVGITKEAAFMMPFAFINFDGMLDLFIESEIAPDISTFPLLAYLLVELKPGANPDTVLNAIKQKIKVVNVFTSRQLAGRDVAMGKLFFGPVMGLLVSIAYVIGMLVVALILFADVRNRIRSFAILKALGFANNRLFSAVCWQSLLILLLALPTGFIIAYLVATTIHITMPVYFIKVYEPWILLQTALAGLVFAILGALVPLATIRHVDPVMALQRG